MTAEEWNAPEFIPDIPWFPEWAVRGACRGIYRDEENDIFFDYPADSDETRQAKRICRGCPVRLECLRYNLWVPYGVFGGYTDRERRALRGDRRSREIVTGFFRQNIEDDHDKWFRAARRS